MHHFDVNNKPFMFNHRSSIVVKNVKNHHMIFHGTKAKYNIEQRVSIDKNKFLE